VKKKEKIEERGHIQAERTIQLQNWVEPVGKPTPSRQRREEGLFPGYAKKS